MQKQNLIGKQFNKLTVIELLGSGPRGLLWRCQCECGKIKDNIYTSELNYKHRQSCERCLRRETATSKNDLTGKKYHLLTALKRVDINKHNNVIWRCQCECGNLTKVRTTDLKQGGVRSCGDGVCRRRISKNNPLPKELFAAAAKKKIRDCKSTAKSRGSSNRRFTWDLTLEEEEILINKIQTEKCNYCGITSEEYGKPLGLDRIVSSDTSYNMKGIVICCKICNFAKSDLSIQQFFTWLKRAYDYTIFESEILSDPAPFRVVFEGNKMIIYSNGKYFTDSEKSKISLKTDKLTIKNSQLDIQTESFLLG